MAASTAEVEAREWIQLLLQEQWGEGISFAEALKDGTRLCKLVNALRPGTIAKYTLEPKMKIKSLENITLFIGVMKRWGIRDFEIFSTLDLADEKNIKAVVICIHALGRLCQSGEWAAQDLPKLGSKVLEKNVSCSGRAGRPLVLSLSPCFPI